MSLYILDTDMLSLFQRGHPEVVRRVQECPAEELAVTIISVEEQLSGWYALLRRAKQPAELARVYERLAQNVSLLAGLHILSFTEAAIARYHLLRTMKLSVGGMDLRIAAIALEHDGTVVTRNLADFSRVPDLRSENWAS